MNFGPKINVGGDLDYIYSRGYYKNNGNKLLSYRLFGSYKSDRYEAHAFEQLQLHQLRKRRLGQRLGHH